MPKKTKIDRLLKRELPAGALNALRKDGLISSLLNDIKKDPAFYALFLEKTRKRAKKTAGPRQGEEAPAQAGPEEIKRDKKLLNALLAHWWLFASTPPFGGKDLKNTEWSEKLFVYLSLFHERNPLGPTAPKDFDDIDAFFPLTGFVLGSDDLDAENAAREDAGEEDQEDDPEEEDREEDDREGDDREEEDEDGEDEEEEEDEEEDGEDDEDGEEDGAGDRAEADCRAVDSAKLFPENPAKVSGRDREFEKRTVANRAIVGRLKKLFAHVSVKAAEDMTLAMKYADLLFEPEIGPEIGPGVETRSAERLKTVRDSLSKESVADFFFENLELLSEDPLFDAPELAGRLKGFREISKLPEPARSRATFLGASNESLLAAAEKTLSRLTLTLAAPGLSTAAAARVLKRLALTAKDAKDRETLGALAERLLDRTSENRADPSVPGDGKLPLARELFRVLAFPEKDRALSVTLSEAFSPGFARELCSPEPDFLLAAEGDDSDKEIIREILTITPEDLEELEKRLKNLTIKEGEGTKPPEKAAPATAKRAGTREAAAGAAKKTLPEEGTAPAPPPPEPELYEIKKAPPEFHAKTAEELAGHLLEEISKIPDFDLARAPKESFFGSLARLLSDKLLAKGDTRAVFWLSFATEGSSFPIWLADLLHLGTRVKAGRDDSADVFFSLFMESAPKPEELAGADEDELTLLFASLLLPAIISPKASYKQYFDFLNENLPPRLRNLELAENLALISVSGDTEDYREHFREITDENSLERALAELEAKDKKFWETYRHKSTPYAPANKIWSNLMDRGELKEVYDDAKSGRGLGTPADANKLKKRLANLKDPDYFREYLDKFDTERTNKKGPIEAKALLALRAYAGAFLNLSEAWAAYRANVLARSRRGAGTYLKDTILKVFKSCGPVLGRFPENEKNRSPAMEIFRNLVLGIERKTFLADDGPDFGDEGDGPDPRATPEHLWKNDFHRENFRDDLKAFLAIVPGSSDEGGEPGTREIRLADDGTFSLPPPGGASVPPAALLKALSADTDTLGAAAAGFLAHLENREFLIPQNFLKTRNYARDFAAESGEDTLGELLTAAEEPFVEDARALLEDATLTFGNRLHSGAAFQNSRTEREERLRDLSEKLGEAADARDFGRITGIKNETRKFRDLVEADALTLKTATELIFDDLKDDPGLMSGSARKLLESLIEDLELNSATRVMNLLKEKKAAGQTPTKASIFEEPPDPAMDFHATLGEALEDPFEFALKTGKRPHPPKAVAIAKEARENWRALADNPDGPDDRDERDLARLRKTLQDLGFPLEKGASFEFLHEGTAKPFRWKGLSLALPARHKLPGWMTGDGNTLDILAVSGANPGHFAVTKFADDMLSRGRAPNLILAFSRLNAGERVEIRNHARRRELNFVLADECLLAFMTSPALAREEKPPLLARAGGIFGLNNPWRPGPALPDGESRGFPEFPPELFRGREDELKELRDKRGFFFVLGGKFTGKTALLNHYAGLRHSPRDGQFAAVKNGNDFGSLKDLLETTFAELGLPGKGAKGGKSDRIAGALAELENPASANPVKKLTLLIDDGDSLIASEVARATSPKTPADENAFDLGEFLRATNRSPSFRLGIAASMKLERQLKNPAHPFHDRKKPLIVRPFELKDTLSLIRTPLRDRGYRFEDKHLALRIAALSRGHPLLANLVCGELTDRLERELDSNTPPPFPITKNDFAKVFSDAGTRKKISRFFEALLGDDPCHRVIVLTMLRREREKTPRNPSGGIDGEALLSELRSGWPAFRELSRDELEVFSDELLFLGFLTRDRDGLAPWSDAFWPSPDETADSDSALAEAFSLPVPERLEEAVARRPLALPGGKAARRASPLTRLQEASLYSGRDVNLVPGSKALGLDGVVGAILHHLPVGNPSPNETLRLFPRPAPAKNLSRGLSAPGIPGDPEAPGAAGDPAFAVPPPPPDFPFGANVSVLANALRDLFRDQNPGSAGIRHAVARPNAFPDDGALASFVLAANSVARELNTVKNKGGARHVLTIPLTPDAWLALNKNPLFRERDHNVVKLKPRTSVSLLRHLREVSGVPEPDPFDAETAIDETGGFDALLFAREGGWLEEALPAMRVPGFAYPSDPAVEKLVEFLGTEITTMSFRELEEFIREEVLDPVALFGSDGDATLAAFKVLVDLSVLRPRPERDEILGAVYSPHPVFARKPERVARFGAFAAPAPSPAKIPSPLAGVSDSIASDAFSSLSGADPDFAVLDENDPGAPFARAFGTEGRDPAARFDPWADDFDEFLANAPSIPGTFPGNPEPLAVPDEIRELEEALASDSPDPGLARKRTPTLRDSDFPDPENPAAGGRIPGSDSVRPGYFASEPGPGNGNGNQGGRGEALAHPGAGSELSPTADPSPGEAFGSKGSGTPADSGFDPPKRAPGALAFGPKAPADSGFDPPKRAPGALAFGPKTPADSEDAGFGRDGRGAGTGSLSGDSGGEGFLSPDEVFAAPEIPVPLDIRDVLSVKMEDVLRNHIRNRVPPEGAPADFLTASGSPNPKIDMTEAPASEFEFDDSERPPLYPPKTLNLAAPDEDSGGGATGDGKRGFSEIPEPGFDRVRPGALKTFYDVPDASFLESFPDGENAGDAILSVAGEVSTEPDETKRILDIVEKELEEIVKLNEGDGPEPERTLSEPPDDGTDSFETPDRETADTERPAP
ncbi:MAG: hypothetical protein LBF41_08180 [Deltaproteobacteria bacterium]|jgi:hypothetical protein|nr:hypothetical protein [Deltaproteobacteria bacterium]